MGQVGRDSAWVLWTVPPAQAGWSGARASVGSKGRRLNYKLALYHFPGELLALTYFTFPKRFNKELKILFFFPC